jgi:hypothetical protein
MKYIKLFENFIFESIPKQIYAKGQTCRTYRYHQDNSKIIKICDNDWMLAQHCKIFKLRPDIFPIVYKEQKNYAILEKLNDKKAKEDIKNMMAYIVEKYNIINTRNLHYDYFYSEIINKILKKKYKLDKYSELYERLIYIRKEILKYYNKLEYDTAEDYPDINISNFGYDSKGVLKMLDI